MTQSAKPRCKKCGKLTWRTIGGECEECFGVFKSVEVEHITEETKELAQKILVIIDESKSLRKALDDIEALCKEVLQKEG